MKTCGICHEDKNESEYAVRSKVTGRLQGHCKTCQSAISKAHYEANKQDYIDRAKASREAHRQTNRANLYAHLLVNGCVDCGESNPVLLEFDHQRDKVKNVSAMIDVCSWESIQAEIDKCDVRCVSCHRIRTAETFGFWKLNFMPS